MINNHIPISADFMINMHYFMLEMQPGIKLIQNIKIKDPNLFARLFDESSYPVWKNQTTYFWNQKFLPGEPVTIRLSYTPASGFIYASHPRPQDSLSIEQSLSQLLQRNVRYSEESEKRSIQEFCPKESCLNVIRTFFLNKKEDFHILRIVEMNVLPYSAKDKPIEKFRLEIVPPHHGEIALCWPKD